MSHTALRREFSDLVDLDAPVDRLAGGFTFTEGPIWHPRDQYSFVLGHAGRRASPLR